MHSQWQLLHRSLSSFVRLRMCSNFIYVFSLLFLLFLCFAPRALSLLLSECVALLLASAISLNVCLSITLACTFNSLLPFNFSHLLCCWWCYLKIRIHSFIADYCNTNPKRTKNGQSKSKRSRTLQNDSNWNWHCCRKLTFSHWFKNEICFFPAPSGNGKL